MWKTTGRSRRRRRLWVEEAREKGDSTWRGRLRDDEILMLWRRPQLQNQNFSPSKMEPEPPSPNPDPIDADADDDGFNEWMVAASDAALLEAQFMLAIDTIREIRKNLPVNVHKHRAVFFADFDAWSSWKKNPTLDERHNWCVAKRAKMIEETQLRLDVVKIILKACLGNHVEFSLRVKYMDQLADNFVLTTQNTASFWQTKEPPDSSDLRVQFWNKAISGQTLLMHKDSLGEYYFPPIWGSMTMTTQQN